MNWNWKTVGIIALFLGVIALIFWAVKSARTGKDIKTGVSNDKIQAAAESAGVPPAVAQQIASAPDSEAAARRIGINAVLATSIANGIILENKKPEDDGCVPVKQYYYDANGNELWKWVYGCTNVNSSFQGQNV